MNFLTLTLTSLFQIPRSELSAFANGSRALERYQVRTQAEASTSDESATITTVTKRRLPQRGAKRTTHAVVTIDSSDDELVSSNTGILRGRRALHSPIRRGRKARNSEPASQSSSSVTSEDVRKGPKLSRRSRMRQSTEQHVDYREIPVTDESATSDDESRPEKRRRGRPSTSKLSRGPGKMRVRPEGTRRSSRSKKPMYDMQFYDEDDISEADIGKILPKAVGAKERFQALPKDNDFRRRHNPICDTCEEHGDHDEKGLLIFCQGCSVSYHQKCLGPRTTRDHIVTKVDHVGFVLQCRRCINAAHTKEPTAPKQGSCQRCHVSGNTSSPFRARQTTREEQKARKENDGEDPSVEISSDLINNTSNVLFRCVLCHRAFHWHHLPPKEDTGIVVENVDEDLIAAERFAEFTKIWSCNDCEEAPAEIAGLVAWRPVDINSYVPGQEEVNEDDKEYLVKYKGLSHLRCLWMPGAWVWGIISPAMLKAFARREDQPKVRTEDAIPEEFLRVDIIFDVEYTNVVKVQDEAIDKARIKEIKRALVKYKGLGYEDVVWEEPPSAERWADFQDAYDDWIMARYVHLPKQLSLNAYIAKLRSQNFEKKIMMAKQPSNLTGGELMAYQMEGLNWLYYQWHKEQNAILADEMGLGKTIQIIGFLSTLKLHGCWPFLVVVPNSTCANWRREIKLWAPSLRVVTYFGSAEAKRLAHKYELFHGHSKDLKCHVVVTSYDAAQDEEFRKVFRGVNWRGLVVDEGQRLKNDKNLLYGALSAMKVPFKGMCSRGIDSPMTTRHVSRASFTVTLALIHLARRAMLIQEYLQYY
jgi:chromodomain-helicase-DNA-binding protein 4